MQYQLKPLRFVKQNFPTGETNALVRFNADRRIEPHAPPFMQTPANLFKFCLCSLTPQARYLRVSLRAIRTRSRAISIHSGRELLGSPILIGIRALTARRRRRVASRRGHRGFSQSTQILSLGCAYRPPPRRPTLGFRKKLRPTCDLDSEVLNSLAVLYAQ